jgi:hypothetical protein
MAGLVSLAAAQGTGDCGNPFVNHFGPWDYRVAPRDALNNVETHHFLPYTEAGLRGVQTQSTELKPHPLYTADGCGLT